MHLPHQVPRRPSWPSRTSLLVRPLLVVLAVSLLVSLLVSPGGAYVRLAVLLSLFFLQNLVSTTLSLLACLVKALYEVSQG